MADEQKKDIVQRDFVEALVSSGKLRPDIAERLYTPAPQIPDNMQMNTNDPTPSEIDAATQGAPVSAQEALVAVEEMKSPEQQAQEHYENVARSLENKKLSQTRHGIANQEKSVKVSPTEVFKEMNAVESRAAEQEAMQMREMEQKIAIREEELLQAATRGIVLSPDAELDPIIESRRVENRSLEEKAAIAAEPTQAEVDREAAPIRKQLATQKAQEDVQAELVRRQEQEALKAQERIKELEDETAPIAQKSKWFQPGSISFVVAAMLSGGAAGTQGRGGNPFLESYRQKIRDDMDAANATAQQKLAAEKMAIEKFRLELDIQKQKTTDRYTLSKINAMDADTGMKLEQLNNQMLATTKTDGLTTDELHRAVPKIADRESYVNVGGKWYQAGNRTSARDAMKKMADGAPAKAALSKLREISNRTGSGFFSPTAWREAAQEQAVLVGALRVPLFGPGVMTEQERKLAQSLIPDPTSLRNAALNERTQTLLNNLSSKFIQAERDTLRAAGVILPPSPNEIRLQQFLNSEAGSKYKAEGEEGRAKAINALIARGMWDSSEDF